MNELLNATQWAATSKTRQDEIVNALVSQLNGFEIVEAKTYTSKQPIRIFSLREQATGIVFLLIPGGTFTMGFDETQERALLELRRQLMEDDRQDDVDIIDRSITGIDFWYPVHLVRLAPFLLARFPLRWSEAHKLISVDESNFVYRNYLNGGPFPNADVAYLSMEEVEAFLQASGHVLPSESQWEYACRAGSNTLFFWGNDSNLCLVENFDDETANEAASNGFGLVNMAFHGDICADAWHDNYEGAPSDGSPWLSENSSHCEQVVRGGAAACYPWQGCGEWLSMLSALRSGSSDCESLGVNVRLAHLLPVL
ncbi:MULTISPECIES: formylglycine-generating enzyme family protein [unclassified Microcoleus]|uniref:formylglycine-generating enzyme family protein n=1 Tax=unclassified Microcoleus TaxID=2642155 RepID=UPI001DD7FA23|nr:MULTISPECIES: formylglycine-generating enzyme family protein [unclassified Microcoleus]MCC3412696.1 formylglycine-generating enzyme family protein [Microcoleus sp. PH2017_02_FOX_O_A]MCC3473934.1 formylglycine-generating enzyme family protein [Microcoleus sp. PH2017_13_LAR_U_A]MCC3486327.1 formylglycine-generating enzyme family protein [Microcoleus sp. PH2017_14_LAR_D_A]MCC3516917.1 formylglycine-generating enzyme family protein [Microcoleus sp. PH2017_18_LLB_O_A]